VLCGLSACLLADWLRRKQLREKGMHVQCRFAVMYTQCASTKPIATVSYDALAVHVRTRFPVPAAAEKAASSESSDSSNSSDTGWEALRAKVRCSP